MKSRLNTLFFAFFIASTSLSFGAVNHWETAVSADSTWKYFVGIISSSIPSTDWYIAEFDDQNWASGKGRVGYGDVTSSNGTVVPKPAASVFLRKNFTLADTSAILEGYLSVDYDDAFIAYLNGVEVGRSSGLTAIHPSYSTYSTASHESKMTSGGLPENFKLTLSKLRSVLKPGRNSFAIEVHNENAGSSDLVAIAYLSFGIKNTTTYFPPTPTWLTDAFNAVPLDYTSSNLPIIKINTSGKSIPNEPKIIASMGIIDNGEGVRNHVTDPINGYSGTIGIERRGATSQNFAPTSVDGLLKKYPYGFETWNADSTSLDVELFGMPAENDWTLYSEFSDNTMLNNTLAYYLGNKMGQWAPRTRHFELFLNNKYSGVYELIEKIKRGKNRVNIAKLKSTDNAGDSLTGGYIFAIDRYDDKLKNGFISKYTAAYNKQIKYEFVYPKYDDITTQQKAYLQAYVDAFEKAVFSETYTDTATGYSKYIDVPSFVNYLIINELSKNVDGYRISSYFHKDKDSKGGKIKAGPLWDYNLAFGNPNADYYTAGPYTGWMYNMQVASYDGSPIPYWWARLMTDPNFQDQLKTRWTEIRKSFMSSDSITAFLDAKAELLKEAQKRNVATFSTKYFHSNYQGEVDYLKSWILNRLNWMDINIPGKIITTNPELVKTDVAVWPNPFVENVSFRVNTPDVGAVHITICDLMGRIVQVLDGNDAEATGWNGCNRQGSKVADGVYIYRISMNDKLLHSGKLIKVGNN